MRLWAFAPDISRPAKTQRPQWDNRLKVLIPPDCVQCFSEGTIPLCKVWITIPNCPYSENHGFMDKFFKLPSARRTCRIYVTFSPSMKSQETMFAYTVSTPAQPPHVPLLSGRDNMRCLGQAKKTSAVQIQLIHGCLIWLREPMQNNSAWMWHDEPNGEGLHLGASNPYIVYKKPREKRTAMYVTRASCLESGQWQPRVVMATSRAGV